MADANDFKVTGKGSALATEELSVRYKKMIEGALLTGISKAVISLYVTAGGEIIQDVLNEKIGSIDADNPSGILGDSKKYVYSMKEIDSGFGSGGTMFQEYQFWIRAKVLRKILIEAGALIPKQEEEEESSDTTSQATDNQADTPSNAEAQEQKQLEPPDPEPEPEPEPEDPPKFPPEKIPSEDPSKTKSEDVYTGETHSVMTKKDPLRVRSGPSLKAKVIWRLPQNAKVRVLDEFLGKDCNWHKIEILDPELADARKSDTFLLEKYKARKTSWYCHSSYLSPHSDIPPSLTHVCTFKVDPNGHTPDWKVIDPYGHSCFYNPKEAEYQALIELPYQNEEELKADYMSFESARMHILDAGIRKLLYYYNKISTEEKISEIFNAFKGAYIPSGAKGFYLDKRPGSFMRFLVCFPAKYFDAINEAKVDVTPASENSDIPGLKTYHSAISSLRSKIELVAKKMDQYAEEVDQASVDIQYLDLKSEARRLREVPAAIENFLSINGHPTSNLKKEMTVEIGLGSKFLLEWVYLNVNDKKSFPLAVGNVKSIATPAGVTSLYYDVYPHGFGLAHIEPINNSRTMAYLYYLDNMVTAIKKNKLPPESDSSKEKSRELTWSGFVQAFTYPIPKILPSSPPEADKKPTAKSAEKQAKKKEKKYKKPPGEAKTTSELKKETKEISNPDVKSSIASGRAKKKETVGDSLFEDLEHVLRKIVNLDDIYDQLLNKYSIDSLAKLTLSLLSDALPFGDLQNLQFETVLNLIPDETIDNILSELKSVDPMLYKEAKKLVHAEIESAKEKGTKFAEDMDLISLDESDNPDPTATNSISGKSKKGGNPLKPLTVGTDSEPTDEELLSTPVGKNARYASPKKIGSVSKKDNISPTKVGKSQNVALGIDFDVDVSLEGSGASILKQLPPNVRKQLKGPVGALEKQLDSLIDQKKEMIKKMLNKGTEEATTFVKNTIEGMIPEELKDAADVFSSVTDEVINASNKPRKPPKNPLLELPDNFNTSDPMASIVPELESAVEEALTGALMGVVKSLLKELKSMVDDLLKGKAPGFGRLKNHLSIDAAIDAFKRAGSNLPEEVIEGFMNEMIDSLTGPEMSDLLEGKASNEVKRHIKSVVAHKNPELETVLSSGADVENVFSLLGDIVGQDIIDMGREPVTDEFEPATSGLLCDPNELLNEDYDGRLSPKRAREQNDAEKERLRDLAKKLQDIIEDEGQIEIDSSLGCPEGIFPQDIPSLTHMNRKVIDSLFTSIKMSFSRDAASFTNTMITTTSRPLAPGDPAFIGPKEDNKEGPYATWSQPRIDLENQKNATTKQEVAPHLRQALRKKENFAYKPDFTAAFGEGAEAELAFQFRAKTAILGTQTSKVAAKFKGADLTSQRKLIASMEKQLSLLKETEQELLDQELDTSTIDAKIETLEGGETVGGSISSAKKELAKLLGYKKETPPDPKDAFIIDGLTTVNNIVYKVPMHDETRFNKPMNDSYTVTVSDSFELGINFDLETSEFNREKDASVDPQLEQTINWEQNTGPSDAFDSMLRTILTEKGIKVTEENWNDFLYQDSPVTANYLYTKIFQDLTRRLALLVSRSPYFDIENLGDLNILPPRNPLGTLCPPGASAAEEDLLDISKLVDDIKDSYEDKCEPLGVDEETTTVLEDEMRGGLIKTIARVFMIETLIKSIFCFTEWDAKTISQDKLFVDYIAHNMKVRLEQFNPKFYKDLCLSSKDIVSEMVNVEADIEDSYNLIDKDILENEENPLHSSGEEAFKLLALQQLPDLLEKLSKKIGKNRKSIDKVFTDPPSNRDGDTETTPNGMPILIPSDFQDRGGLMRTIDCPKNVRGNPYDEQSNRFLDVTTKVDAYGNATSAEATELKYKYPELKKPTGVFYIERYIRIGDKDSSAAEDPQSLAAKIQKRNGGSNYKSTSTDPSATFTNTTPHLAGVVNFDAWYEFIEQLINEDPESAAEMISDYFHPWRYGLRLMWALPSDEVPADQKATKTLELSTLDVVWEEIESNPIGTSNSFAEAVEFNDNQTIIEKEKAFWIEESAVSGLYQFIFDGKPITKVDRFDRVFHNIPLIQVEMEISSDLNSFKDFIDNPPFKSSETDKIPVGEEELYPYAQLKQQLLEHPRYKLLFEYIYPLPRIATLMTIYTANSIGLAKPEINNAFNGTKEACRSLFYNLSTDANNAWWERKDQRVEELGGNAGLLETYLQDQSSMPTTGPKADLLGMALRAVPVLIRGVAEQTDPHYGLISKLVDSGVPALKKNWTSVPLFWPVTIPFPAPPFVGWGPPLTPWGMMAYSLPDLTGDEKKYRENKEQETATSAAVAQDDTNCEEE